MSSNREVRRTRWLMITAVCAAAGLAWGVYAVRYAGSGSREGDGGASVTTEVAEGGDLKSRSDGVSGRLLATTPSGEPDRVPPPLGDLAPVVPAGIVKPGEAPAPASGVADAEEGTPSTFGQVRPERVAAAARLLHEGRTSLEAGDLIAARRALSDALDGGLAPDDEGAARAELARIAEALLFSRTVQSGDPLAASHTVIANESLNLIARRYQVTEALLARINRIADRNVIHLGDKLKVVRGPFHAIIDKSDHRMDVYAGTIYVRSFPVGLGMDDATPTGVWRVRDKLVNPEWVDPSTGRLYLADDPDNPIGEHWIGLEPVSGAAVGRTGFGLHGTNDPASIGRDMSMGCVRLLADDIAGLYDLLVARKSTVVIRL